MKENPLIGEDEFDDEYKPIYNERGDAVVDEVPPGIPRERVWTIVEGDSGDLYASAGYHRVNRIGYVVTEKPWERDDAEALWHHFESDDEEGEPEPQPGAQA